MIAFEIPPAIVAPSVVDADRILVAILSIENNPWGQAGGGFGFTRGAWFEDTDLAFAWASNRRASIEVARSRVARFVATCAEVGLYPGPENIADMWRRGFARAIHRMRRGNTFAPLDYGVRAANLYNDPSFRTD